MAGACESRSANDGLNAAANEVDPIIAAQRDGDGIQASEEEVPVSTGTLYRHDNNDGYTFEGRTVSEVGGSSTQVQGRSENLVQGTEGQRTGAEHRAPAPVSERMTRNLRLPVGIVRIDVKAEMGIFHSKAVCGGCII